MKTPQQPLPIDAVLPELQQALEHSVSVVLQAPPGSGKTTRVPLALSESAWLQGQKILMLEPRRLAATNAARYMASLLGQGVGESVGYSIRYARKTSAKTRVEVVTEGLLTRRMQRDPELKGVGLVIFDEFHERSLQADLALALCRDIQQGLREDLRILVMSATLDAEPVARLLGDCSIVTAEGRSYPVSVDYLAIEQRTRIAEATAQGVRRALAETAGDILTFLPGAGEINRCRTLLSDLAGSVRICPLYGNLPFAEQEQAILPGEQRRVVLATNVAETSLTIEGIQAVVDSGWEKRLRFDAARGMGLLETVRISQASAVQRAGRAGRLGPGRCYRLWSEGQQGGLLPFAPPEIRQADLAPLAFELLQWGENDPARLAWLDQPPAGHLHGAHRLLNHLGALDDSGRLTELGRMMARYPAHPRLARLLVAAVADGCPGLGCDLVALLSERDLVGGGRPVRSSSPSDLLDRLELLKRDRSERTAAARRTARYWRQRTPAGREESFDAETVGRLLAVAYPDRLARQRRPDSGRYLLRNGQGASMSSRSAVRNAEWLVAVEVSGRSGEEGEICLASTLSRTDVEELFGAETDWQREVHWDDGAGRVVAREVRRLGAILLQERPVAVQAEDSIPAFCDLIRRQGLELLPWSREASQLQARVNFLHEHCSDQAWPDWSSQALLGQLDDWLPACLHGVRGLAGLARVDLYGVLKTLLGWQRFNNLERLAPERLAVPSGSKIRIDYTQGTPVLAVKLQELFGLDETPRLADGRVPVLIHLLSPAARPLAVTADLKSFWNEVYPEVQKEMKGRYPKHPWPDDPWSAQATRKTKKTR